MNNSYMKDFKNFEREIKAYYRERGYKSADVLSSILDPSDYGFSLFTGLDTSKLEPNRLYSVTFIATTNSEWELKHTCWGISQSLDVSLGACMAEFKKMTLSK